MATYMTFSTLTQDVQNYLERGQSSTTDQTVFNQIPRLINAAERKLAQVLKLQGQIEPVTDPSGLPVGVAVISKPDRWRQTVSLNYGTGTNNNTRTKLLPRSYEFCRTYWPDDTVTDITQPPLFYADYDYQHWLIAPTPPATYPLEVLAYMQPPLLDSGNQTNFFSEYTPNLLLYGTLLEAEPFIKDDPRIPMWQRYWQLEIQSLSGQDLNKIIDRAAERARA